MKTLLLILLLLAATTAGAQDAADPVVDYNPETCELSISFECLFCSWYIGVSPDQVIGIYPTPQPGEMIIWLGFHGDTDEIVDLPKYPEFDCIRAVDTEGTTWGTIRRRYR